MSAILEGTPDKKLALVTGRAYPEQAHETAKYLGIDVLETTAYDFANGEMYVRYTEPVRGADAFVMQAHTEPINKWIMEQLIMVDAMKRASARSITVVAPFLGYSRQDKKHQGREPITARLIFDLFRFGAPTTMIGLDVTLQTLLTYKETQQWRDLGTKAGKFLADMTDFYIKAYETTSPHLGGCGLHDPLAVGVAVDPTLVTTLDINMKVDVEGPTRGRTIGDETRLNDPAKTMKVAVGVDVPRFLNEFMTRISGLAAKAE